MTHTSHSTSTFLSVSSPASPVILLLLGSLYHLFQPLPPFTISSFWLRASWRPSCRRNPLVTLTHASICLRLYVLTGWEHSVEKCMCSVAAKRAKLSAFIQIGMAESEGALGGPQPVSWLPSQYWPCSTWSLAINRRKWSHIRLYDLVYFVWLAFIS